MDAHYGSGLSFRDPDGVALEFFDHLPDNEGSVETAETACRTVAPNPWTLR